MGLKDELEVQEVIFRKEKELEEARIMLIHMRKSRYQNDEANSPII